MTTSAPDDSPETAPELPEDASTPGQVWLFVERIRTRLVRFAADRRVRIGVLVAFVVLIGSFGLLWFLSSRYIDLRLAVDSRDARSGVFAAPLVLRPGQPLERDDLVTYLEQLGYGSGSTDDTAGLAGRFSVAGNTVTVEPLDPEVTGTGEFPAVTVIFSGNAGIAEIRDTRTDRALEACTLEPLVIASTYNTREKRMLVEYDAIPATLRTAILTTEDRRFWTHRGVDYRGIARAMRENWGEPDISQGGSTITQQVVKNVFLTPERTYTRKIKEAWLSFVLEWKLAKTQIFALYCNEVYLGQRGRYAIHGFAEASREYFDKELSDLTLDESALLAGIINAPSTNSPYRHPDRAKARRDLVLDMLLESGAITAEQVDIAKAAPLVLRPLSTEASWVDSPYFSDYVQAYLEEVYSDSRASLEHTSIYTTVDVNLQRAATRAVAAHAEKLDAVFARSRRAIPPGTVQAALVAINPKTGAVVAMVGGRDYNASQFNRATDASRQPGSVFKPFVYSAALTGRKYTPATLVMDAPQIFTYGNGQTYEPDNYGQSYANRDIPLRVAFRNSKNVPTVNVAVHTGLDQIAGLAERAGLPRPELYPSMALGVSEATPLEIAQAYTAFVNGGSSVEPTPIASDAATVAPRQLGNPIVFTPQVAYVMTNMMEDVVAKGTGRSVRARGFRGAVAGKTGTSRDGWFVGYTPNLVCVVWVGFDDNQQLGLTGAESALPIWTEFMKDAIAFRPELGGSQFERPSGVSSIEICAESGYRPSEYCLSTYEEVFLAGTEPIVVCETHTNGMEGVPMFDEFGNPLDPLLEPEPERDPEDRTVGPEALEPPDPGKIVMPVAPVQAPPKSGWPSGRTPRTRKRAQAVPDTEPVPTPAPPEVVVPPPR
ncbi:MAG: PBP1A family penicillin-binding protein [Blastocatellia bacterium]|nr:PBP1A family penicillin-binding protein [Blastocatellia bacterium]